MDLATGRRIRVPLSKLLRRTLRELEPHAREPRLGAGAGGDRGPARAWQLRSGQLRVFNANRDIVEVVGPSRTRPRRCPPTRRPPRADCPERPAVGCRMLRPGDAIPAARVWTGALAGPVPLRDAIAGGGDALLCFYPFDWSPTCTSELRLLHDRHDALDGVGIRAFGVSLDGPWSQRAFAEALGLGKKVTLISDRLRRGLARVRGAAPSGTACRGLSGARSSSGAIRSSRRGAWGASCRTSTPSSPRPRPPSARPLHRVRAVGRVARGPARRRPLPRASRGRSRPGGRRRPSPARLGLLARRARARSRRVPDLGSLLVPARGRGAAQPPGVVARPAVLAPSFRAGRRLGLQPDRAAHVRAGGRGRVLVAALARRIRPRGARRRSGLLPDAVPRRPVDRPPPRARRVPSFPHSSSRSNVAASCSRGSPAALPLSDRLHLTLGAIPLALGYAWARLPRADWWKAGAGPRPRSWRGSPSSARRSRARSAPAVPSRRSSATRPSSPTSSRAA